MIWAMRRQLSGVVKYCWPASCWPASTSHSRNSAFSRPSLWRVMRPVTSACALMVRQLGKFGTLSTPASFSRKAAGSIGRNRPEPLRLAVMIWVTPVAVSLSLSAPPKKFGMAIGSGWKLPSVMSRRTTAAAWRADSVNPPAAAPSASARRRVTEKSGLRKILMMVLNSFGSAAEQLLRIEFELKVFPLVVMLGLEHGERLAQQQRALGALGQRRSERGCRALDQHRLARHRRVLFEQDAEHDIDFRRRGDAGRRAPAAGNARAQRVDLALRQLRRGADRRAEIGLIVQRLGRRHLALRIALVEQLCDLVGVELGRVARRRVGTGLVVRLRLLGDILLLQEIGDLVGLVVGRRLGLGRLVGGLGIRLRVGLGLLLRRGVGFDLRLIVGDLGRDLIDGLGRIELVGDRLDVVDLELR